MNTAISTNTLEAMKAFIDRAHIARAKNTLELKFDEYGFIIFLFEDEQFIFVDRHIMNSHIHGQEVVLLKSENKKIIWSMMYSGIFSEITETEKIQTLEFFNIIVQSAYFDPNTLSVRGPKSMEIGTNIWMYDNICASKDIANFEGNEKITHNNKIMFSCKYNGNLLVDIENKPGE